MDKLKSLYAKHRDAVLYIIFGVCSTVVNIVVYYICAHPMGLSTTLSAVIAWVFSVVFAYVTNKIFVFRSKTGSLSALFKEITNFVAARLATGAMDLVIMFVFVDMMHVNDMLVKIASNVLVVILNYILSKLFVFKNKK